MSRRHSSVYSAEETHANQGGKDWQSAGSCGAQKKFLWYLGYYGAAFALVMLLFLHRANDYFVADDWTVIASNRQVHLGWRRPLFESFVALCWKLFGLNATGYL